MRRLARILVITLLLAMPAIACVAAPKPSVDLEQGFRTPPNSARPWVYWFWLNGNITREGITADLEAMKKAGIGGVLIMEVDQGAPLGPVPFAGAQWRLLFHHVITEAHRLGLQVNMNDDAGWNGSGGPWITPDKAMQKLVWTETPVQGGQRFDASLPQPQTVAGYYRDVAVLAYRTPTSYRIPDIQGKAAFVRQEIAPVASYPATPEGAAIPLGQVINLTTHLGADGHIAWDVPEGQWTILRMGYTPTGAMNAPSPASGRGLECDKLSKEGAEAAFDGFMAKLISDNGMYTGSTLVSTHIDSWENGSQNWTPRFREEFIRLRGYDPLLYLPAITGQVVGSLELSERFLWDLRKTAAEMVATNYAGHMRTLAHRRGIRLSIEAYGDCVFDDLDYAGHADEPMTEFWSWPGNFTAGVVQEMASAAHVYGKRILGAEAFTAGDGEKWLYHPGTIKALGDWAFCQGVNRFVFHRYALQPWLNRPPGMSMGPWGLHYERTQTWWAYSQPWHRYLSRCQYLLQQGLPVADILYLAPEDSPRTFNPPAETVRSGYKSDACSPEALLTRVKVKNGLLALPDGMTYRVLVLPGTPNMTPRLLRKIKELVDAGATVIGNPPVHSPGLSNYPRSDAEVRALVDQLWSRGRIKTGKRAEQILAARKVAPDLKADRVVDFIHRRIGATDVYFVANVAKHAVNAACTFRVTGRRPEIWDPESGRVERVATYTQAGGVTRLTVRLEGSGSAFVVFRDPVGGDDPVVRLTRDGKDVWGGPAKGAQIVVRSALWGPAGDVKRTKNVTAQVQRMIAAKGGSFLVAELASEGDPAFNVVKTLTVQYSIGGKSFTATATDPQIISFELPGDAAPAATIERLADGKLRIDAREPGLYVARSRSGHTYRMRVGAIPRSVTVTGVWDLAFTPGWGAPAAIKLPKLISWSDHTDPGVKYYSGTAVYRKAVNLPKAVLASGQRITLDLGRVEVVARVLVNGRDLGILWKAPYAMDVTSALRPGVNRLEIRVANLWPNRMIGDEQLPEDSARNPDGTLREWPKWLEEGKPSPTGRYTFTSWRLWRKDSPLQPSGLLGPVRLRWTESQRR